MEGPTGSQDGNGNLRHRQPPQQLREASADDCRSDNTQPKEQQEEDNNKPKRRRRRLRWTANTGTYTMPNPSQIQVFMNMQLRKMRRRVHGRREKGALAKELCLVVLLVFVIVLIGALRFTDDDSTQDGEEEEVAVGGEEESENPTETVSIIIVVLWFILAFIIIAKSPHSPVFRCLKWMIVYIPLFWGIAEVSWTENGNDFDPYIFSFFMIMEIFTLIAFVSFYKLYPLCLRSRRFGCANISEHNYQRAARMWGVNLVSNWTMTYFSLGMNCKSYHSCKYEGETDPDHGLPQGMGRWLDDSWEGEMITGYWKDGQPVAPFSSWSYGTDDAVSAVRVAYFNATDDPFDKNALYASNESTPTCGIASVECSVSGSFYQHLPEATLIEGPYPPNNDKDMDAPDCYSNAIQQCIEDLDPLQLEASVEDSTKTKGVEGLSNIEIRATDTRGIQVVGHIQQSTRKFFDNESDQITIQVKRTAPDDRRGKLIALRRQMATRFSRNNFLPRAPTKRKSVFGEIVMVDIEESDDSDCDYDNEDRDEELGNELVNTNGSNNIHNQHSSPLKQADVTTTLHVQNWIPVKRKEALIFLPGYNSCTKHRLENFGQFLAMSKLSSRVYPIVFCWPGSVGPGYWYASQVSGNAKNFDNLHKLVASIHAIGIRTVHFMTHSMGVQTLLGAFQDKYDKKGNPQGRSTLSLCFQLDSAYFHETEKEGSSRVDLDNNDDKLVCKTITMLNPDFPLEAFVDRGFLSLRRICRTVTVIGDRNDGILWWSSVINGLAERFQWDHCSALQPLRPEKRSQKPRPFHLQERIGVSIDSLHYRKGGKLDPDELAYQTHSSHFSAEEDEKSNDNSIDWLDMDVIDMTGLDTNIAGGRHSSGGFSLNAMLLKDIEELIRTGKRAMKRPTLLYREGNVFSYTHAPSFVSF